LHCGYRLCIFFPQEVSTAVHLGWKAVSYTEDI